MARHQEPLRGAFNSFSEFNKAEGGDIWFALDETRPLACFDVIEAERAAVEKRSLAEDARWESQKQELEAALRRARE